MTRSDATKKDRSAESLNDCGTQAGYCPSSTTSVQVESVRPVKFLNELIKTLESQIKVVGYVDSRIVKYQSLLPCMDNASDDDNNDESLWLDVHLPDEMQLFVRSYLSIEGDQASHHTHTIHHTHIIHTKIQDAWK